MYFFMVIFGLIAGLTLRVAIVISISICLSQ